MGKPEANVPVRSRPNLPSLRYVTLSLCTYIGNCIEVSPIILQSRSCLTM